MLCFWAAASAQRGREEPVLQRQADAAESIAVLMPGLHQEAVSKVLAPKATAEDRMLSPDSRTEGSCHWGLQSTAAAARHCPGEREAQLVQEWLPQFDDKC